MIVFNKDEKRLDITELQGYIGAKVYKDGQPIADIPLVDGCGFITNTDDIQAGDKLEVRAYVSIDVTIES